MQINYYMNDDDRDSFHEYIFSRGGYIVPQVWRNKNKFIHWFNLFQYYMPWIWWKNNIPIITSENKDDIDKKWTRHGFFIWKEDVFSKDNYKHKWWTQYTSLKKWFRVYGSWITYSPSYTENKVIYRGRIYVYESRYNIPIRHINIGKYRFVYPPSCTLVLSSEERTIKSKQMENFYRSICNYIRKNFRNYGFYHGPGSDKDERNWIKKLQDKIHPSLLKKNN